MGTMTCREMGGACEVAHSGSTADEVIKAQDRHLRDVGDSAHEEALQAMKGRWRNPVKGMGWYRQVKRDFAARA
jgi:hypothetical protein